VAIEAGAADTFTLVTAGRTAEELMETFIFLNLEVSCVEVAVMVSEPEDGMEDGAV
jgi:hypothetical protein